MRNTTRGPRRTATRSCTRGCSNRAGRRRGDTGTRRQGERGTRGNGGPAREQSDGGRHGAGNPDYPAHIVYEDETTIAFLDKYPHLYSWTLVAPREHREQVTGDFTIEEYLDVQRRVYRVAEAVRREVGAERVYLLALGSNQGHSHVHWHVAPLPPGVPYTEQQLAAFRKGILRIPEEEMASLAARIRHRMEQLNSA